MKEMELLAVERLIVVYSDLYKKGITKEITEKAKYAYNEWTSGHTLLSDTVNYAVSKLFSVAYPNLDPDRKTPSKEEIQLIISNLKKRKDELEHWNREIL